MTEVRESTRLRLLPTPAKVGHVPAIDGLRAIAVLAVVIYHAKPTWLPGGLTGVDIFFAISGFVVPASILWRDFASPTQALAFFYTRRLFRIFPALILMLVVTSLAVFLFVPRSWLGDGIVQTGLAAFFGTSNITLRGLEGDYFSPQALFNPFLHTWSLGVEEQFYVVFSVLMFALGLSRRPAARACIYGALLLLTMLSVAAAVRWSGSDPTYAFYLLPTRFWELGIGVLAYLALDHLVPWLRGLRQGLFTLLAAGGAAGLLAPLAIGTTSGWIAYPFPAVLPCVAATALLMVASIARPGSPIVAALSVAPLRAIGLISYSLYLWHWPLFVLMRWTIGFTTPLQIALGVVASFVVAALSYHLVETPLRRFAATSQRPRRVLMSGAIGAAALALGLVFAGSKAQPLISLSVTKDAATWFPYKNDAALARTCKVERKPFALSNGQGVDLIPQCRTEHSGRTLFIAGDSHALALTRMLEGFASTTGMEVRLLARPGCATVFSRNAPDEACKAFIDEASADIEAKAGPRDIVFLPGLRTVRQMEVDGSPAEPSPPMTEHQAAALGAEALSRLRPLAAHGVPVIIEAPQPTFRSIAFRCSDWFNRSNPDCSGERTTSRPDFDAQRRPLLDAMAAAAKTKPSISVWDPSDLECAGAVCRSWLDGKPMFFDGDHASGYANDRMLPGFRAFVLAHLKP